jgi:hypothetical protein
MAETRLEYEDSMTANAFVRRCLPGRSELGGAGRENACHESVFSVKSKLFPLNW